MTPLLKLGARRDRVIQESDVWNISPTMCSKALYAKFSTIRAPSLARQLWDANKFDMLVDLLLTYASVALDFMRPFFLKRILDALSDTNDVRTHRAQACVYALLALVCALAKAQMDAAHMWCGRRASMRVRSELMAVIYQKAVRQRDLASLAPEDGKRKGKGKGTGSGESVVLPFLIVIVGIF